MIAMYQRLGPLASFFSTLSLPIASSDTPARVQCPSSHLRMGWALPDRLQVSGPALSSEGGYPSRRAAGYRSLDGHVPGNGMHTPEHLHRRVAGWWGYWNRPRDVEAAPDRCRWSLPSSWGIHPDRRKARRGSQLDAEDRGGARSVHASCPCSSGS